MRPLVWLCLIVCAALLLRAYPLESDYGWDESAYLQDAMVIAGEKDNYSELAFRPPLLSLLLAPLMLFGLGGYAPGIFIAILNSTIVLALYLIGKELWGVRPGLFSALLGAIFPLFVEQGHLVLTDALVATFALWALALALRRGWQFSLAAGILAGACALTKFTGFLAIPLLFGWIVARDARAWREWGAFAVGAGAVVLGYFSWSTLVYGSPLAVLHAAQALLPPAHVPFTRYLDFSIFTLPLLLGVGAHLLSRRDRFAAFALIWAGAFLAYFLTLAHKEPRYLLIALAPLLALAGAGYDAFAKRLREPFAIVALALFIVVMSAPAFERLEQPLVNRWESPAGAAARFLAGEPEAPLYVTSHYPMFAYRAQGEVVVVDGPHFERAYRALMPQPGYLVIAKDRPTPPTIAWAQERQELSRIYENEGFAVYRYSV